MKILERGGQFSGRKQISGCLRVLADGEGQDRGIIKVLEVIYCGDGAIYWGDGHVDNLDYGNDFWRFLYVKTKMYILSACGLLHVNYALIKDEVFNKNH